MILIICSIVACIGDTPVSAGTTSLISRSPDGSSADNPSNHPSISGDGRYITVESRAGNLTPAGSNGKTQIYLCDQITSKTILISHGFLGELANGSSGSPSISEDGKFIAFSSYARNIVPGDTNECSDIFLWNRSSDQIIRVSTDSNGNQVSGASQDSMVSEDGTYVVFSSVAHDLVNEDLNGYSDIFRKNTRTNETILISSGSLGQG
ncbi:MAG: hypothetical protein LUQ50_06475, partial [Methanospirillum sp.]|uniref:TolB family protein n=1 Tax=Methanospirillum sp. TaxID=45200 RepID=UPI00236FC92B